MLAKLSERRIHSGHLAVLAMAGLLIAIAAAGLVGLGINSRVRAITDQAVKLDIELEDRGDDFRVAVLDLRHYHRNIAFAGPSRLGLIDFDAAYAQMQTQIDRLAELEIDDPRMPAPESLRRLGEAYYVAFRPAIELYVTDRTIFDLASDEGLVRLAELSEAGRTIDHLGEQRAAAALRGVEAASESAQLVLITVLGGLILVGIGLTYLVIRNMREQRKTSLELARMLQIKNDFIADASHELRTPLTVLRANAELAITIDDSIEKAELLDEILQESDRMTRLVGDLLFLASSDAGSLPLQRELVEIEPFLVEFAARASVLAREYGSPLRTELTAIGLAEIDGSRIEQAGLILIDNAGKYGIPDAPIIVRSKTQGHELLVEVEDHGLGIPESELSFIFERFYRVDRARSRRKGGTGLGLAIARSIIEGHGGRILAESQVGRGTTMRIYLPIVEINNTARKWADHLVVKPTT
jgi:two-component system, OmpR family, sensor histidine kinase VicK